MANIMSEFSASIGTLALSNVLFAIITLIVCLLVIRLMMKLVDKMLNRSKLDAQIRKYVHTGVKMVLYVIGALIVVDSLGIPITSLVALLSVASLGITLAIEDVLGNVAGGMVIMSSKPFAIGDFVEANGASGTVAEITLNHTKLTSPDGLSIMLPNQELASSKIINYTAMGYRRVSRVITASYDAPTEAVKKACMDALDATEYLITPEKNAVYLSDYKESSIEYTIFCWTDSSHYWDVYFGLNENLRGAFAKHGVEMTYDHLNVHIVEK